MIQKRLTYFFEFGPFRLSPEEPLLLRDGEPVSLPLKAYGVLGVLVRNSGYVVTKDELMDEVWPDQAVEESNLTQNISVLRRALGESPKRPSYIETIPRRGYRFCASVREVRDEGGGLLKVLQAKPEIDQIRGGRDGAEEGKRGRDEESALVLLAPADDTQEVPYPVVNELTELIRGQHLPSVSTGRENGRGEGGSAAVEVERQTSELLPERAAPVTLRIPRPFVNSKRGFVFALILMAFAATGILLWHYRYSEERQRLTASTVPLKNYRTVRITNTGNVKDAVISADGRYVVYVTEHYGRQAIWVRQVVTASAVQVTRPTETQYEGLTLSPDGNFIYYLKETQNSSYALYRMPIFGGPPQELVAQLDGPAALSPDGARIAFVRKDFNQDARVLLVANADGSGERQLAVRRTPEFISNSGPAWSPDGTLIANVVGRTSDLPQMKIVAFEVASGAERPITARDLPHIVNITWAPDGRGLFINAGEKPSAILRQMWYVPYPGGQAQRITNDVSDYGRISLTADSRTLVTVRKEIVSGIWTKESGAEDGSASLINVGNFNGYSGLSLTPDGRVVYSSNINDHDDIWIMDADGSNPKQLTDNNGSNNDPTVAPDGRSIIFVSDRTGTTHIWKMNLDGSRQQQLTEGGTQTAPQCTPDGKFVVYQELGADGMTIWEVLAGGGQPVRVTASKSLLPFVSPDGSKLAYYYFDVQKSHWKIAVKPMGGSGSIQTLDMPPSVDPYFFGAPMRWAPGGRSLAYVDSRSGVYNVWELRLDGSAPRQLTNFKYDGFGKIARVEWSRDAKRLVFTRNTETRDIIMITEGGGD
jgi:Tol biopolymer transport system component/DNA-binding winged helix-turn-helix (wHTH) protein